MQVEGCHLNTEQKQTGSEELRNRRIMTTPSAKKKSWNVLSANELSYRSRGRGHFLDTASKHSKWAEKRPVTCE